MDLNEIIKTGLDYFDIQPIGFNHDHDKGQIVFGFFDEPYRKCQDFVSYVNSFYKGDRISFMLYATDNLLEHFYYFLRENEPVRYKKLPSSYEEAKYFPIKTNDRYIHLNKHLWDHINYFYDANFWKDFKSKRPVIDPVKRNNDTYYDASQIVFPKVGSSFIWVCVESGKTGKKEPKPKKNQYRFNDGDVVWHEYAVFCREFD